MWDCYLRSISVKWSDKIGDGMAVLFKEGYSVKTIRSASDRVSQV